MIVINEMTQEAVRTDDPKALFPPKRMVPLIEKKTRTTLKPKPNGSET